MNKYKEPDNLAVISCSHVIRSCEPILLISHDLDDGGWQFLCGNREHEKDEAMIVVLEEIVAVEPTILDMADLKLGYIAQRLSKGERWVITKNNLPD